MLFFWNFFIPGWVGTHQNNFFYFLFPSLSQSILARKEAQMVFLNFLNFFAIFLEFSIPGRVRTHRNDFFYFLSFSAFPNLFWLEKKPKWCFLVFWIFLAILYSRLGKNWSERFFLFFLFLGHSQPLLAWKEAIMVFLNFLNFFANFLEFSVTGQVEIDRNEKFCFLSFSAIPFLFWLEVKP